VNRREYEQREREIMSEGYGRADKDAQHPGSLLKFYAGMFFRDEPRFECECDYIRSNDRIAMIVSSILSGGARWYYCLTTPGSRLGWINGGQLTCAVLVRHGPDRME
jgi:hypothetical protein